MAAKAHETDELTLSVELLWGGKARPSRGPKPTLSVEKITAAAIEIADAEGLGAVSMQRVAGEFGFTTMSLYRYVPGKTELVALMIDAAVGPPPALAAVRGGWRPKLREWAYRLWDALHAHPWVLHAAVGLRPTGPNELGWLESAVAALTGTGLDGNEMMDAVVVLSGHVRSLGQQTLAVPPAKRELTEQLLSAALMDLLEKHGDRFPALVAAMSTGSPQTQDHGLDFGLDRILDGLAQLIASRSPS